MTTNHSTADNQQPTEISELPLVAAEKVLCPHCLRTATNGISCKGICVADSDY